MVAALDANTWPGICMDLFLVNDILYAFRNALIFEIFKNIWWF